MNAADAYVLNCLVNLHVFAAVISGAALGTLMAMSIIRALDYASDKPLLDRKILTKIVYIAAGISLVAGLVAVATPSEDFAKHVLNDNQIELNADNN